MCVKSKPKKQNWKALSVLGLISLSKYLTFLLQGKSSNNDITGN